MNVIHTKSDRSNSILIRLIDSELVFSMMQRTFKDLLNKLLILGRMIFFVVKLKFHVFNVKTQLRVEIFYLHSSLDQICNRLIYINPKTYNIVILKDNNIDKFLNHINARYYFNSLFVFKEAYQTLFINAGFFSQALLFK